MKDTNQTVDISVLMPTLNNESTIGLTIKSILCQTFENFELIVIDDGSSDKTASVVRGFKDDRVRFISDGLHKGIYARLNEGLKIATGRWIARMDADDIAYPERFEKQISFLEANPEVDLLGTAVLVIKNEDEIVGKRVMPTTHAPITEHPLWRNIRMSHPTFMGKASWFHQFKYEAGTEDQDLLLRTYKESNFCNLSEILLAYTEAAIIPLKYKKVREFYLGSLVKTGHVKRFSLLFILLKAMNTIKYYRDKFALISSLQYKVLKNRATPANDTDIAQFRKALAFIKTSQSVVNTK